MRNKVTRNISDVYIIGEIDVLKGAAAELQEEL